MNKYSDNNKSVAFLTLGCKVNSYESDAMQRLFEEAGYQIKEFSEIADVYVVNTCTVTNIADRKSRQMLHKAKKLNRDSVVVAVGCYVQASKEALEADEAIDLVVGNNQKQNIVSLVESYFEDNNLREAYVDISQERNYEAMTINGAGAKTRAYIKVQDGCNQFCSYCIIPYTRGRVRSRNLIEIVTEITGLVQAGYKEVVLTGIHLSSYGIDFDADTTLLTLIKAISLIEGLERIRLGSLEPRIVTEELVSVLSKNKKFCPHFHLSLQSGCNETLKRMNRRYSAEEYYDKCCLIREYFDKPAITTDIIVGFPQETETEYDTTVEFVKKVEFAQIHVFKYSMRKGTKAAEMAGQVNDSIKHERSEKLIALGNELREKYESSFLGTKQSILVEESVTIREKEYQIGHNERYVKLAVESEKDLTNQIVEVSVKSKMDGDLLLCEISN